MSQGLDEMTCEETVPKEAKTYQVELDEENANETETEQAKISQMRAFVESQNPSAKEVDDLMLRRFLRARGLDIRKASALFLEYLKWRHSFVPGGSISVTEIPNEIAQNKMFLQGFDKKGRPISVVYGARHFQNRNGLDEFKRYVVYALDKICTRMPPGQEKFVVIGDLKGWGFSNSDIRGYLGALSILQDYYPERLGKLFIINAPYIFIKVWKIVCPFIDNKTRKKIEFVQSNKLKATLFEEIDESQIPEPYGGQLPLVPIHELKSS